MRLKQTYIQSFNYVHTAAQESEFTFKQIKKSKPHHKLMVRPSLAMGYCHGTDITANNNTFVLNSVTYTIPSANYTGATLATALNLLTTPQTFTFLSSGKLQLNAFSASRIFSACDNSAYLVMGFVEGVNYTGTNISLTNTVNLDIQSTLNLKMPEFQGLNGYTLLSTSQTGVTSTKSIQGKYVVASQLNNQTVDNEDSSGSFLMNDLPITPLKIAMELPDGTPMITTNHIFYNIIFTIMEVDCEIVRPVEHKVVACYIRTMSFGTSVSAAYVFTSKSFTGLFKRKPSNKWLIFNAMTNQSLGSGSGRFLFMTHPALTGKSAQQAIAATSTTYTNNHYLGMNMATSGTVSIKNQLNDYLIVDDLSNPEFEIMVGQITAISGSWDWDTTFNIFEIEY